VAFDPTATSTMTTYLNQWVKIASGDRVFLSGGTSFTGAFSHSGYLVFKCSQCGDNWHVGLENFSANGKDAVPAVLQDWVKKHRHVCKKFLNSVGTHLCNSCKWPYGAHEESWINKALVVGSKPNVWVTAYEERAPKETPAPKGMTLKQFTGRKFRDTETEPCELPDTSTEKTSLG
jgi:hypothetical protein